MDSDSLPSRPVLKYDARSVMAAGFCLMALFFNVLGWLLAIVGIVLLRRAVFQPKVKWILAAVALAPKILFLGVQVSSAPLGMSFAIEPRTLATSSALWSWSILLAACGSFFIYVPVRMRQAAGAPVQPTSSGTPLFKVAGVVAILAAAAMLTGLTDDFQRIEEAENGRWALKHAVRGTVATFTRDELESIEAIERRTRGSRRYSVRVGLRGGRTFSASTTSSASFQDLRKFATTADLRPGTVHIRRLHDGVWTNGTSGFTLKDCIGTYEYVDARRGERSTFEFWSKNGRLAGKETVLDGPRKEVQILRDIKISDTGETEFQESPYAAAGQTSKSTVSFSLRWSSDGESGRFTKDGLEIGLKKYRRL